MVNLLSCAHQLPRLSLPTYQILRLLSPFSTLLFKTTTHTHARTQTSPHTPCVHTRLTPFPFPSPFSFSLPHRLFLSPIPCSPAASLVFFFLFSNVLFLYHDSIMTIRYREKLEKQLWRQKLGWVFIKKSIILDI